MQDLFGFFGMAGNYEQRKIDRYDSDDGSVMVSTAAVTDSRKPYETAVAHPKYNDGKIVIVELYDDKKKAQIGHNKWVKKITAKKLPAKLVDVSSARIAEALDSADGDMEWRVFKKQD